MRNRTKTDTGRQGEYPKALERTVFKELGNLTPYVRNKGSLTRHHSFQKFDQFFCHSRESGNPGFGTC
jgi:hypothetical protein